MSASNVDQKPESLLADSAGTGLCVGKRIINDGQSPGVPRRNAYGPPSIMPEFD